MNPELPIFNSQLQLADIPSSEASWNEIQSFALTFDWRRYFKTFSELAELANQRRSKTLAEMRACLFFEQRRWRHFDEEPDFESMKYLRELLNKIRQLVEERNSRVINLKVSRGTNRLKLDSCSCLLSGMSLSALPYWSDNLKSRLSVNKASSSHRETLQQALENALPSSLKRWPYGMPTSVNPFVVLVGISPGATRNSDDAKNIRNSDYSPSIGEPHPYFDVKDEWKSEHWRKARFLCRTILKKQKSNLSERECLTLSGHLNLGTKQTGNGADPEAIEPRIAKWVPKVITGFLKPKIVVLLGMNSKLEQLTPYWRRSAFSFVYETKPVTFPLIYTGSRKYNFRLWKNPDVNAYPKLVLSFPNHPSRHPFSDMEIWKAASEQAAELLKIRGS